MEEILLMLLGFIVRIGLPVGVTALIVILLRRLDAHWQTEAELPAVLAPVGPPCWEQHNCSPEKRAGCKAFQNAGIPCWQQFRKTDGTLRETCIGCEVFRQAPIPTPI